MKFLQGLIVIGIFSSCVDYPIQNNSYPSYMPLPAQAPPKNRPIAIISDEEYLGIGSGHWITDKNMDSTIITLEDGSIWKIDDLSRVDSILWMEIDEITVLLNRKAIGENDKYLLINTSEETKAYAKYLGD